jgi:hypothetical protein
MRKSTRGRAPSPESGASAVEFAIVLPLLVLFVFGIIEFGLTFFRSQGLEAAAREGGRVAAIGLPGSDVDAAVRGAIGGVPIDASHLEICIEQLEEGEQSGDGDCVAASSAPACSERNVRVSVQIAAAERERYGIRIPGMAAMNPPFRADALFRCEIGD